MKILAIVLVTAAIACSAASPMIYTRGVPNIGVVDAVAVDSSASGDPYIVRSGQIATQEGWDYIAELAHGRKVHVVKLNFEAEGSDDLARKMGFDVVYVPIQPEGDRNVAVDVWDAFKAPDAAHLAIAKATMIVCKAHPDTDFCDVHCTHGQDRTGELVGEYRVEADGWPKDRAYQEMIAHNYHPILHGLHERWENFHP